MERHESRVSVPPDLRIPADGVRTKGAALQVAAGLFGVSGAIRAVLAVLTAFLFDPRAGGAIFLSAGADTALYGASPRDLIAADPALVDVRWTIVMALSGALAGLGVLEMAVAWFGLRTAQQWALIALSAAGFAVLPFWWLVAEPYIAAGVALGLGDIPPFMSIPALLLLPAVIIGSIGLRGHRGRE